jgi:hypothetical protein
MTLQLGVRRNSTRCRSNEHAAQQALEATRGNPLAPQASRTILAIDIHHIVEVSEGGGNEPGNLVALCPTCHALFHRGEIVRDSIYAWKSMLVSLSHAFDVNTIDDLLFLATPEATQLRVSGDGVLKFSRLVASGLASFGLVMQNGPLLLYKSHSAQEAHTSSMPGKAGIDVLLLKYSGMAKTPVWTPRASRLKRARR